MKISVCMATYNGEKFILKQLHSILEQLNNNDELVISDDSSIDHTVEIIKSLKDDRIKLFENNRFKSPIYNFENALKHSSGNLIFLSDQDDLWGRDKVLIMSKLLKCYDLVVSDCKIIDESDTVLSESFFKLRNSGPGLIKNLYKNSYLGCCMAFKRNILNNALPFPQTIPMHDMWIGMVAEVFGNTYFCNEKLIYYRKHRDNISATSEKSTFTFKKRIFFRINLIIKMIRRKWQYL